VGRPGRNREPQMKRRKYLLRAALGLSVFFFPTWVYPQTLFYKGRTITIVQSSGPGGTADMRIRSIMPFLQKYVPGNPTIVTEYMPGGGGRKAANYIYRARPDGLRILSAGSGVIPLAMTGEVGVLYDIDKLIYLGTPYSAYHSVFFTRKELGLNTVDRLRGASGVRVGAQSVGHATYSEARLFAYLLGLKEPSFIVGYTGPELDLALASAEIDARSSATETVLSRKPDWVEKALMDFHAILEVPKGNMHPRFSHLPELETFAKSDKEKKVLALLRAFKAAGAPIVLPPATPEERVAVLREAFRRTFKDPAFHKEYKKVVTEEPTPLMPEVHEKVIREIPRSPEVTELFKRLSGPGPLPPR